MNKSLQHRSSRAFKVGQTKGRTPILDVAVQRHAPGPNTRFCKWQVPVRHKVVGVAQSVPEERVTSVSAQDAKTSSSSLTKPISLYDVDKDIWDALDICSDEELELLYNTLFGASPFSPILKSLTAEDEPALIELRGRSSVMHKIESRFRLLAASSTEFLRGKRPSYREALFDIRDRLEVQCSSNLSTPDLETEIFLHISNTCMEYVQDAKGPNTSAAMAAACHDDGMSASATPPPRATEGSWAERVTAPIRFGVRDMVPTAMKFGSAVAVAAMGKRAAQQVGTGLVTQHLRYQAALTLATASSGSVTTWQCSAMLQAAQKGVAVATARYGMVRGALSLLGPVMWGWLAVDLAMKAVGTDYARIIKAVFLMAQVRLLKTQGFVNPQ